VVDDDWGSDLDFGSLMGEGDITGLDDSEEVAQQSESAAEPIQGQASRKLRPQERPSRPNGSSENRPGKGPRPEQEAKGKGRDIQPRPQQQGQNQNKKPRPPREGQPMQENSSGDRPKIAPKIIPRVQSDDKGGGESGSEG
jgi:hypothetical protein